jgi:WD40 repeat protein
VYAIVFSPDGRWLASGSRDQTVRIWESETGEPVKTLEGHGQFITGLVFSPSGDRLAGVSWFRTLMLWHGETLEPLVQLRGHEDAIRAVAFSPDGTRLVTGSADRSIRLWDARPRDAASSALAGEMTIPSSFNVRDASAGGRADGD